MKQFDENYFKNSHTNQNNPSIESLVGTDEQLLWKGKPKRKAFIWSSFFTLLPVALIWLLFDGTFIGIFFSVGEFPSDMFNFVIIFLVIFFAFHLLPVWIWLSKIFLARREHKNIEYAFTNKRIIIKSGIIGIDVKNIYYSEIQSVNLKVGLIEKIFSVGDIYIKGNSQASVLCDIENPYFITQKLQEIVIDIKSDIEFPNNLRPSGNSGYKTTYDK